MGEYLCLAPWVHTYCSPQGERRMCCASREPSKNFKQYIDTETSESDGAIPSLDEHWNSDHMKSVRRRMMAGEKLPECEVCNHKLLNTDVYRDYFNNLFKDHRGHVLSQTDVDGTFEPGPISFDYRFSNLCNFKCRMCGPMLSSQWESEARKYDTNFMYKNPWAAQKELLKTNQDNMYVEMMRAVQNGTIEEVYWAGGEPLMYREHWDIMKTIVRSPQAKNVFARYNTNLSAVTINSGANDLYGILRELRDWQICASLDGTEKVGEYIRTGLDYDQFIRNYMLGKKAESKPNQMRLDFTITLPGLTELTRMHDLAVQTDSILLTKVCFTFGPDVPMSPLIVDRETLNAIVDDVLPCINDHWKLRPLKDTLLQFKNRPVTEEEYPDTFLDGRKEAKRKIQEMESRRNNPITMDQIVKDTRLEKWWNEIG